MSSKKTEERSGAPWLGALDGDYFYLHGLAAEVWPVAVGMEIETVGRGEAITISFTSARKARKPPKMHRRMNSSMRAGLVADHQKRSIRVATIRCVPKRRGWPRAETHTAFPAEQLMKKSGLGR